MKKSYAPQIKLVLGILIGGGFLYWALSKLDLAAAGKILSTARPEWIALAVLLLLAGYTVRAYRWWRMLRSVGATADFKTAFRIFLVAVAMNNVLPFRAGDVSRAMAYGEELGAATSQVVGTMVVERILDFLSLLVMFFIALMGVTSHVIPESYLITVRVFFGILVAMLVGLLVFAKPVRALLGKFQTGFVGKVAGAFVRFLEAVEAVAPAKVLVPLIALSLPAWLLESGLFVCTAYALRLDVPIGGPMLGMATGTIATLLPSTPGFVGTFDAAAAQGIRAYGVADTPATVFALLSHVVLWVPLTALGFGLLSIYSVRRTARSAAHS